MGFFSTLFNRSASANEWALISTFESTLKEFQRAPLSVQTEVGRRIFADLNSIGGLAPKELQAQQQQIIAKYRGLRPLALRSVASSDQHPAAYAALMESLALAMTNEKVGTKLGGQLMQWLASIRVIERS
jgi:hypothetical protein